ncbi:MAG: PIN domain-containing protein [Burkholderiaceae bacterium]
MIVLDTNVLSALMRTEPDASVLAFLDRQDPSSVWITAVTVFEVRFGLHRLAAGRRRRALEAAFEQLVADDLDHRVLGFDASAAAHAAQLAAAREAAGRPVDLRDTWIAGIVAARGATLITRNLRHFRDLDVRVVDPWA